VKIKLLSEHQQMASNSLSINLSAIDEGRWGVRTAKAFVTGADQLPLVLDFCREQQVKFLITRCPVSELRAVQSMERQGFLLMDTLLYFIHHLRNIPAQREEAFVRPVEKHEADTVRQLAARAFCGYSGHYHADERLDREQCDAVYGSWAYGSCTSRELADDVLVCEADGGIGGFITLRARDDEGEGPLYGVEPALQGHGIGQALMIAGLNWVQARGLKRMVMSTQIINLASQIVWTRLDFEPLRAEYTFHRWFD
jgi:GNAT superfamily N-acetyltransferase